MSLAALLISISLHAGIPEEAPGGLDGRSLDAIFAAMRDSDTATATRELIGSLARDHNRRIASIEMGRQDAAQWIRASTPENITEFHYGYHRTRERPLALNLEAAVFDSVRRSADEFWAALDLLDLDSKALKRAKAIDAIRRWSGDWRLSESSLALSPLRDALVAGAIAHGNDPLAEIVDVVVADVLQAFGELQQAAPDIRIRRENSIHELEQVAAAGGIDENLPERIEAIDDELVDVIAVLVRLETRLSAGADALVALGTSDSCRIAAMIERALMPDGLDAQGWSLLARMLADPGQEGAGQQILSDVQAARRVFQACWTESARVEALHAATARWILGAEPEVDRNECLRHASRMLGIAGERLKESLE